MDTKRYQKLEVVSLAPALAPALALAIGPCLYQHPVGTIVDPDLSYLYPYPWNIAARQELGVEYP